MINQKRLIQTFIDLVKIDSPSGEEQAIVKNVCQKLEAIGLRSEVDSIGNTYTFIKGMGEGVVLNAHFDTVEPGRNVRPQIKDGIIRSDGKTVLGADNKAALAAILEVIQVLSESTIQHYPIELVLSVKEETESGIKQFDFSHLKSKKGFCFDSSGPIGNLVTQASHITEFHLEVTGKAAHAGIEPEKGINALTAAAKAMAQLSWGRIDKESTANVGLIKGGEAVNTVPRKVELAGDVRSISLQTKNALLGKIEKTFKKEAEILGGEINFGKLPYCEGYVFDQESDLVRQAVEALGKIGKKVKFIQSNGGADANLFNAQGIAMLNFGYGARNIHTVAEEISVENLSLLARLVLELII